MFMFTKENATGMVRTIVPFLYAWVAINVPNVIEFVEGLGLTQEGFVLLAGSLLYQLIRAVAERWSWVGYLLVVNQKPAYDAGLADTSTDNLPV